MKKNSLIFGGVVFAGVVTSLANAANDYGLRTNKLHPHVAAQSSNTSGGTTYPGDGYYPEFKMDESDIEYYIESESNERLYLPVEGKYFSPVDPLCMYRIVYVHNYCVYTGNSDDYCNFGLEGITLKGFNKCDGPGGTN